MKVAVNAPFSDYSLNVGSMTYGLAPQAKKNEGYLKFLRDSDKYTILDNGADEGNEIGGQDLWDLVQSVQPDELILPDVLKDPSATIENSRSFYHHYIEGSSKFVPGSLMAVAQGETYDEFLDCFTTWEESPFVDVIGIPYDIDFEVKGESELSSERLEGLSKTNKRSVRRALLVSILAGKTKKKIHLLGMNNLAEFISYRDLPDRLLKSVRSNDTTGPFAAAIDGRDWMDNLDNLGFEKDWPALDFNHEWSSLEKQTALKNLMVYAALLGDHGMSFNLGKREGLYESEG